MYNLVMVHERRPARAVLAAAMAVGLSTVAAERGALGQHELGLSPVTDRELRLDRLSPVDSRQRIDPTFDDLNPLSRSIRHFGDIDLRLPLDFEDVYRIPGKSTADDRFARISGGLSAVFPHSVYVRTEQGLVPDIPPGTIFYIGPIPEPDSELEPPHHSALRVDTSVRTDVSSVAAPGVVDPHPGVLRGQPVEVETGVKGIMTDDQYRSDRVRSLLRKAAASR